MSEPAAPQAPTAPNPAARSAESQLGVYKPSTIHLGGSTLSPSMLATWTQCRQEYFLHYLAPHPQHEGTAGLGGAVSLPMFIGSAAHMGLYHYRLSGFAPELKDWGTYQEDKGTYSLNVALDAGRGYVETHRDQLAYPGPQGDEALEVVTHLLRKYDEAVDKNPLLQWRTATDPAGQPLLEREYTIPLLASDCGICEGRGWYEVTGSAHDPRCDGTCSIGCPVPVQEQEQCGACYGSGKRPLFEYVLKMDAAGTTDGNQLRVIEYKTSYTYGARDHELRAPATGQVLAEIAALLCEWPDAPVAGAQIEVLVKDRGKDSKLDDVLALPIYVDEPAIALHLEHVEKAALEISWTVAEWRQLVEAGRDPWEAGLAVFSQDGKMNGQCVRYKNRCPMFDWCVGFGLGAERRLSNFEPRTKLERS